MTLVLLMLATLMQPTSNGFAVHPTPVCQTERVSVGKATYYAPGLMQTVYANRLLFGHVKPCTECVGFVVLPDCAQLGNRVFLRHDGTVTGPFLSVDCAAPGDLTEVRRRGIVVEVDYELGLAWAMRGPVDVEVLR